MLIMSSAMTLAEPLRMMTSACRNSCENAMTQAHLGCAPLFQYAFVLLLTRKPARMLPCSYLQAPALVLDPISLGQCPAGSRKQPSQPDFINVQHALKRVYPHLFTTYLGSADDDMPTDSHAAAERSSSTQIRELACRLHSARKSPHACRKEVLTFGWPAHSGLAAGDCSCCQCGPEKIVPRAPSARIHPGRHPALLPGSPRERRGQAARTAAARAGAGGNARERDRSWPDLPTTCHHHGYWVGLRTNATRYSGVSGAAARFMTTELRLEVPLMNHSALSLIAVPACVAEVRAKALTRHSLQLNAALDGLGPDST